MHRVALLALLAGVVALPAAAANDEPIATPVADVRLFCNGELNTNPTSGTCGWGISCGESSCWVLEDPAGRLLPLVFNGPPPQADPVGTATCVKGWLVWHQGLPPCFG